MAQKAVEIILTRQLASYLAMPIFLVRPRRQRSSSTTSRPRRSSAAASTRPARCRSRSGRPLFAPTDDDGTPIAARATAADRSRCTSAARRTGASGSGARRRAPPDRGHRVPARWAGRTPSRRGRDLLGGRTTDEGHAVGHARLAGRARAGDGRATAATPSCVEVRGRRRHACWSSTPAPASAGSAPRSAGACAASTSC